MAGRKLDYYDKGLSMDDRQELFTCFKWDIGGPIMKKFLEKEDGYKSFHRCDFTDENIKAIWDEVYIKKVARVNSIMERNNRPPLFSDITDSFQSAKEYFDLFQIRSDEELIEFFGCTYEDYVPETIK